MIPYDIDPSLHDSEPEPEELGDGFSPPVHAHNEPEAAPPEPALSDKSPF